MLVRGICRQPEESTWVDFILVVSLGNRSGKRIPVALCLFFDLPSSLASR
jgi:hypothetical protein